MSDISREELKTILLFGVHVAKLDNDMHALENKILKRFVDAIHLSDSEKADLLNQDISLGHGLAQITSDAARTLLLKTMCAVASVDGTIGPEEQEFIERVVVKFGQAAFILPKEEWKQYEEEVFTDLTQLVDT